MPGAKIPAPISWAPSQYWYVSSQSDVVVWRIPYLSKRCNRDGIDGNWSSFDVRVGTPEQLVRILPSTAASATWVVVTGGCDPPSSACSSARGGLFNFNQSSSWDDLGIGTLLLEQNLGRNETGLYGTDTLSLGLNNATGGPADTSPLSANNATGAPTLQNQIIAGIETSHYLNGIFGLSRQPMYMGNLSAPRDSFLTNLRNMNMIPSLSWAYTAGARYSMCNCADPRRPWKLNIPRINRCLW